MADPKKPKEIEQPQIEIVMLPDDDIDRNPFQVDFINKKLVLIPTQVTQRLDIDLNDVVSAAGGALFEHVVTFTSGDATPSVKNANVCITAGTTAITDFDDGTVGQTIRVLATANITITDGAPIILNGSANYTMTNTDTLTLTMFNDQVWNEVSRSVN